MNTYTSKLLILYRIRKQFNYVMYLLFKFQNAKLAAAAGKVQGPAQADVRGHGCFGQCLQTLEPELIQHLPDVATAGPDMTVNKTVGVSEQFHWTGVGGSPFGLER